MITVNHLMSPIPFLDVQGVIFDCDGVLVDSYDGNTFYYNWFKDQFGLPVMNDEEMDYVHAHNVFASLKFILPEEHWEAAFALRPSFDYRLVLPHIRPEPGIFGFLELLRDLGIRMAVNTSRTDTTDMLLNHVDMSGYFNPVIASVSVANPKPHPEGVNAILDAWNMYPDEVVYIGDSSVDERTARAAGVPFWAYGTEKLDADLYIPEFPTLTAIFRQAFNREPELL